MLTNSIRDYSNCEWNRK